MCRSDISSSLVGLFQKHTISLALSYSDEVNNLILVNDHFCKLTGYQQADLIGKNCRLLQRSPHGIQADNTEASKRIRIFLRTDGPQSIRTTIVNFRKNGTPFVNLIFMSKLKTNDNKNDYIIASQFDVSSSHTSLLEVYNNQLSNVMRYLKSFLYDHQTIVDSSFDTVANSAATIAQARIRLDELRAK